MSVSERALCKARSMDKASSDARGRASEERVGSALDYLVQGGKISTWWSSDWKKDHYEGIDAIVQLPDGQEKPLQIKSSRMGFEHARECHPNIPCIIVSEGESLELLANRIRGILF